MFHVFNCDPLAIDLTVFNLWLEGFSVQDIVSIRVSKLSATFQSETHYEPWNHYPSGSNRGSNEFAQVVLRDTKNQIRVFESLQHNLTQPRLFFKQTNCRLAPQVKQYIIDRHFSFNDAVIRELVGKKLTTKLRKDMDEVFEITKKPLRCCVRQFDNLRLIFNAMDDRNFQANVAHQISEMYCLAPELSCRYTCILFILYNRFNITSNKKKTAFLKLKDIEYCASIIISNWLVSNQVASNVPNDGENSASELVTSVWKSNVSFDLDSALASKIRDIKLYLYSNKHYFEQMMDSLHDELGLKLKRTVIKAILVIGAGLAQAKEYRDLFEDISTTVVEPFLDAKVAIEQVEMLFEKLETVCPRMDSNLFDRQWSRYITVMHQMTVRMIIAHP